MDVPYPNDCGPSESFFKINDDGKTIVNWETILPHLNCEDRDALCGDPLDSLTSPLAGHSGQGRSNGLELSTSRFARDQREGLFRDLVTFASYRLAMGLRSYFLEDGLRSATQLRWWAVNLKNEVVSMFHSF